MPSSRQKKTARKNVPPSSPSIPVSSAGPTQPRFSMPPPFGYIPVDDRRNIPNYLTHTREWNAVIEDELREALAEQPAPPRPPSPSVLEERHTARRATDTAYIRDTTADIQRTVEFSAAHNRDLFERWRGTPILEREEIVLLALKLTVYGSGPPSKEQGNRARHTPRITAPDITLESMAGGDGQGFIDLAKQFLVDLTTLPAEGPQFPIVRHPAYEKRLRIQLDQIWPANRAQRAVQESLLLERMLFVSKFVSHVLKYLDGTVPQMAAFLHETHGGQGDDWIHKQGQAGCKTCRKLEQDVKKLLKCGACLAKQQRHVYYCSRACQLADWPNHRSICGKPIGPTSETPIFSAEAPRPSPLASPQTSRRLQSVLALLDKGPRGAVWVLPTEDGTPISLAAEVNAAGEFTNQMVRLTVRARQQAVSSRTAEDVALFLALLLVQVYHHVTFPHGGLQVKLPPVLPHIAETFELSQEDLIRSLPSRRRLDELTQGDVKVQATIVFSIFVQLGGTYDLTESSEEKTLEPNEGLVEQARCLMPSPNDGKYRRGVPLKSVVPSAQPIVHIYVKGDNHERLWRAFYTAVCDPSAENHSAFIDQALEVIGEDTFGICDLDDPRRDLLRAALLCSYRTFGLREPRSDITEDPDRLDLLGHSLELSYWKGDKMAVGLAKIGLRLLVLGTATGPMRWTILRKTFDQTVSSTIEQMVAMNEEVTEVNSAESGTK